MENLTTVSNVTTVSEVTRVIETLFDDTNRMWADGAIAEDSAVRHVEDGLTAVQYAPHYDGGKWGCTSGHDWVEGTAAAAASGRGQGWAWTLHDLNVLPRSEDEAIASYRVVHTWGASERPPAQAFFLETWRRGSDGRWRLARHTAEKL